MSYSSPNPTSSDGGLDDNDLFIVSRNSTNYKLTASDLMTVQDTDLFVVSRNSTNYKVTGEELLDYAGGSISPSADDIYFDPDVVSGSGTELDPYVIPEFDAIGYGLPALSDIQICVKNQKEGRYVIWTDIDDTVPADRWNQPVGIVNAEGEYKTYINYLDSPASSEPQVYSHTLKLGEVYFNVSASQEPKLEPPVIGSVNLVEIENGVSRYTNKQYPYTTDLVVSAEPAPTFGVKAKLSGTTFNFDLQSDVINNVETGDGIETHQTDVISNVDTEGGVAITFAKIGAAGLDNTDKAFCSDDTNGFDNVSYTAGSASDLNEGGTWTMDVAYNGVVEIEYWQETNVQSFKVNGVECNSLTTIVGSRPPAPTRVNVTSLLDPGDKRVTSVSVERSMHGTASLHAVYVDGQRIFSNTCSLNPNVLSFPTNNNFEYFKVGDVVQFPAGTTNNTGVYVGDLTANFYIAQVEINGKLLSNVDSDTTIDLGPYTDNSSSSTGLWANGEANEGAIENGAGDTKWRVGEGGWTADQGAQIGWTKPVDIKTIRLLCASGGSGVGTNAGIYDQETDTLLFRTEPLTTSGLIWRGADVDNPPTIIAKDADSTPPTITVEGGVWVGSDNTGTDFQSLWKPAVHSAGADGNQSNPAWIINTESYYDGDAGTRTEAGLTTTSEYVRLPIPATFGTSGTVTLKVMTALAGTITTHPSGAEIATDANTLKEYDIAVAANDTELRVSLDAISSGSSGVHIYDITPYERFLGDDRLTDEKEYDTKLTFDSDKDLATMLDTLSIMTDGNSPLVQTPYKLTTSGIIDVDGYTISYLAAGSSTTFPIESAYTTGEKPNGNWATSESASSPGTGFSTGSYTTGCTRGPSGNLTVTFTPPVPKERLSYFRGGDTADGAVFNMNYDGVQVLSINTVSNYVTAHACNLTGVGDTVSTILIEGDRIGIVNFYDETQTWSDFGGYTLTFDDPCPDLKYFKTGDVVQTDGDLFVKVQALDLTNRKMDVSGGDWNTSNQSQVWSDSFTSVKPWFSDTYDNLKAFDGDDQTYATVKSAQDTDQEPMTFSPVGGINDITSIEIKGKGKFSFDGVEKKDTGNGEGVFTINDVASFNTMTIDHIATPATGIGSQLFYIKINGQILVDKVNDSQVWSNYISTPYGTLLSDAPATNAADGNLTTSAAPADKTTTGNDPTLIFDITSLGGLAFTDSVRVYRENGQSIPGTTVQFNDEAAVASNFQDWTTIATGGGTLNKITTINPTGNNTVGISAIEVDGKLLVDTGARNFGDSNVQYQTNGGEGTVVHVESNTAFLSNSGGRNDRFIADNQAGQAFYLAPAGAVPITSDVAYGKLQVIDDKAVVRGIQKDDPGFLPVSSKDYTIQFGSTFQTGNAPDDDLPLGVAIAAIVQAENSEGKDEKESNTVLPVAVNPENAAGPITDSTPTTLTVDSASNLDKFEVGDNLVMVDDNNYVSYYTMQTSSITSATTVGQNTTLSFETPNPDLKFFRSGDAVQGGISNVISAATPLKGTRIRANGTIANALLYGLRINGEQLIEVGTEYSSQLTLEGGDWDVGSGPENAFDADLTNRARGGDFYWKFSPSTPFINVTKIEVYSEAFSGYRFKFEFDGHTGYTETLESAGWYEVTFELVGPEVKVTSTDIASNTMVVTGGTWITADDPLEGRVWSNTIFTTGNDGSGNDNTFINKGNIFDNDKDTTAHANGSGTECVVTFYIDPPIPVTSKVSYWGSIEASDVTNTTAVWNLNNESSTSVYTNGGAAGGTPTSPTGRVSENVISFTGELSQITITKTSPDNTGGVYIGGFAIDDQLLVDAPEPGQAEVTYGPVTGTGVFASTNDTDTITMSSSNDRWIDDTNRLGTEFYCRDNVTVLNANNPKHVALQQAISDAFDNFEPNVSARTSAVSSAMTAAQAALTPEQFALIQEELND